MKNPIGSVHIVFIAILLTVGTLPGIAREEKADDQVLTTTFTVNSTSDAWDINPGDGICATSGGQCTLRAAILETNALSGGDTIILPAGNYKLTAAGTMEDDAVTGDLDIRGDLTINGAGKNSTIIDMDRLDRAFDIHGAGLVIQISNLTIQNGFNEDTENWDRGGGGIFVPADSTLSLENVYIYNNRESPNSKSPFGGGIYSQGDLTLLNTDIISNTAYQGGGIALWGLGILTMTSGQIIGNTGGGILTGKAILTSVLIADNTASSGGGIQNSGVITITHSTISGNSAKVEGGGIWSNGIMMMIDCLITENEVTNGSGGGIANTYSMGTLLLIDSTISSNTAYTAGGGIETKYAQGGATIRNSQVISNTVLNGNGAGIHGVPRLMVDSTVSGNQSWGGNGAGIYGGCYKCSNITIDHNIAWDGDGGGFYGGGNFVNSTISGNQAARHGGGIFHKSPDILKLSNVTVAENVADNDSNESGNGGGIFAESGIISLTHTILGNNLDNSTIIVYPDCDGTFVSLGYNLIQTVSPLCNLEGDLTGNMTGISPELDLLRDNGGATYTHLPQKSSPILDAGNPAGCRDIDGNPLNSDQRGFLRPLDGNSDGISACDLGAVEIGVTTTIQPGVNQTLVYTDTHNNTTTLQIPSGAVTESVELEFSPVITVTPLISFTFIEHAFELLVYREGILLPGYSLQAPVTTTIQYAQEDVEWVDEEQLKLMMWSDAGWGDAALTCDPLSEYNYDTLNNAVSLPICHLSLFGVFGPTRPPIDVPLLLHLPLVIR